MNKKVYEICSKTKISNDLARHEVPLIQLTDLQKDMFMYLCVKAVENVEKNNLPFESTIELSMKDFFSYSSRSNFLKENEANKNLYRQELLGLFKKTFYISTEQYLDYYHYIDYIHIDKETYVIKASLSTKIKDLAYKTVEGYTQIEFGNYAALRKKYSKDLYKYLRSYLVCKHHSISIEKLYDILNVEEDSIYRTNIKEFKRWVLMPAIEEINKKTDINVRGLYNVYEELYEKMLEKKGKENITEKDKLKMTIDSITLKEDEKRNGKVKGFEFIIEAKPFEERYSYVKNQKLRKQLIENAKKQQTFTKKQKAVEAILRDSGVDEAELYEYAKMLVELKERSERNKRK